MIISHSRKFIFLKTRKTAGTSLEIALSKYCGPRDILTPINYDEDARAEISAMKAQNYGKPLAKYRLSDVIRRVVKGVQPVQYTEHMMAVNARKLIGETIWRDYFKFTIVRNSFDRMLSRFHWTMEMRPQYAAD